jgi:hypothetical protein
MVSSQGAPDNDAIGCPCIGVAFWTIPRLCLHSNFDQICRTGNHDGQCACGKACCDLIQYHFLSLITHGAPCLCVRLAHERNTESQLHDVGGHLPTAKCMTRDTFLWNGAGPSAFFPMYSSLTGSYRPMRRPPNRHCLCKPAITTTLQLSVVIKTHLWHQWDSFKLSTLLPASRPFHSAPGPSCLAIVLTVPRRPLQEPVSQSLCLNHNPNSN